VPNGDGTPSGRVDDAVYRHPKWRWGVLHTPSIGERGARFGAARRGARSDDLSARFASSLVQTEHAESAFCVADLLRGRRRARSVGVKVCLARGRVVRRGIA
jgi:hypothetical protein